MPQKRIPCEDCDDETRKIEDAGDQEVISCKPIPGEDGWCMIVWRRKS